jgi:hypothetical protein
MALMLMGVSGMRGSILSMGTAFGAEGGVVSELSEYGCMQ